MSKDPAEYRGTAAPIIKWTQRALRATADPADARSLEAWSELVERSRLWRSRSREAVAAIAAVCLGVLRLRTRTEPDACFVDAVRRFHAAWGRDAPPGEASDFPLHAADDIEDVLLALASGFGATCPGFLMVREVLVALGVVNDLEVLRSTRVRFVTKSDERTQLFTFVAESLDVDLDELRSGDGEASGKPIGRVCVPDPCAFGATVLGGSMLQSLEAAWALAAENLPESDVVRWRFESVDDFPAVIRDRSAGGAFWLAFAALARDPEFDLGNVAVVAKIKSGRLDSVGGTTKKLDRLRAEDVLTCVLSSPVPEKLREDYERRGMTIIEASAINDFVLDTVAGTIDRVAGFCELLPVEGVRDYGAFRSQETGADLLNALVEPRVMTEERRREHRANHGAGALDDPRTVEPFHESDDATFNPRLTGELGKRPAIVIGEPSEGKTMALWFAVWKHCDGILRAIAAGELAPDGPDVLVPLVLPLGELGELREAHSELELDGLALERTLTIVAGTTADKPGLRRWLERKVAYGHYRLFLDALDEYRGDREWLAKRIGPSGKYSEYVARLTSRPLEAETLKKHRPAGIALYYVAPWNDFDIGEAVERYFGKARGDWADTLIDHIKNFREPRHLVRQPLILAILCNLQWRRSADPDAPDTELPNTREAILREALQILFENGELKRLGRKRLKKKERAKLRPKFEQKTKLLTELAWEHLGRKTMPFEWDAVESRNVDLAFELIGDDGEPGDGVLVERGKRYYFLLESFHELGAASYLASEYEPLRDGQNAEEFKRALRASAKSWPELAQRHDDWTGDECPLHLVDWENVWLLLAARLDGERRLWLMEAMLDSLEGADDETSLRLLILLLRMEAEARETIETAEIRKSVIKLVTPFTKRDDDSKQQMRLIRALGESDSDEAVGCLIDAFDRENFVYPQTGMIIEGLSRSRLRQARETLLAALESSPDQDVRALCADALFGLAGLPDDAPRRIREVFLDHETLWNVRQRCLAVLHELVPGGAAELVRVEQDRIDSRDVNLWRTIAVLTRQRNAPLERHERYRGPLESDEHHPTGMVFVELPGGPCRIGSPVDERDRHWDELRHDVDLSPFWIGRTTLSRRMWRRGLTSAAGLDPEVDRFESAVEFIESLRPEERRRFPQGLAPCDLSADDLPLVEVDWEDARRFCALFGWLLPTEAQWEYACRAGSETRFAFGDELDPRKANFHESGHRKALEVDAHAPNDFGLYNMHGNVWEWCEDVFDERFCWRREDAWARDPQCLRGSGNRVIRGGSWIGVAWHCRSAYRSWLHPWSRLDALGFRPARPLR